MQHSIQVNRYGHIPASGSGHIPALDGLRGWAILWVIIWHYVNFLKSWFPGWAGVDLFFVLSGYLITGRLMQTKGTPGYFSRFYRNRVLRIFPVYFAFLLVFFAIILLFVRSRNLPLFTLYLWHWKSFFLFTENWTFIRFGFPGDHSLQHLWSIAVEEQFYLIWPMVIFLTPSAISGTRIFSVAILLVMLIRSGFYFTYGHGSLIYYNTFFRMDSLLAGSLLYQLHDGGITIPSRFLKWVAGFFLTVFIAGCCFSNGLSPGNPFFVTIGYTILALLFACLLHLAVQNGNGIIPRFFQHRFLRFCGRISYGLYIFHVPMLLIVGTKLHLWGVARWPDRAGLIHYLSATGCLLLSFLISSLSYRYFESWFLRFKYKFDQ